MDRELLEFIFAGPLFSIFKQLNHIRREGRETREAIMGLKDDLRQLNADFSSGIDAVAADQQRLEEKLSNSPVAEDVSEELASLRANVTRLQGLDLPDPEQVPDSGVQTPTGGSVLTTPEPTPDTTTVQSPGEPIGSVSDLPEETQPESVPPGQETGPTPTPTDSGPTVIGGEVAAGELPPQTPTVPADSVEDGTVAPDAPVTAAGDVDPADTPVVPVSSDTPIGDAAQEASQSPGEPAPSESTAGQEDSPGEPTNS